MKRIIYLSGMVLLLLATFGCKKKQDTVILPEAKIIKELPVMYIGTSKIEGSGGIVVINSQKELNEIFNNGYTPQDLTNVDFNNNTVIVGRYTTTSNFIRLEHKFTKVGYKYEYTVNIFLGIACVVETVGFGIIVEKIPSNSDIVFKVNVKP